MCSTLSTRRVGAVVTSFCLGASLALAQTTWYVDDNAGGDPGPGDPAVSDPLEDGSAAHPFDAIQEGIDASSNGDLVLVLAGTYTGDGNRDLDFAGRLITVQSDAGPANCVIDCQGAQATPHRGFYFHNAETNAAGIKGLTIRNGLAGVSSPGGANGGGIYCHDAGPTVEDCVIESNGAAVYDYNDPYPFGGGVYCTSSTITIVNTTISNNWVGDEWAGGGGGLAFKQSSPTLTNCVIAENEIHDMQSHSPVDDAQQGGDGGGVHFNTCTDVHIVGCTIRDNRTGRANFPDPMGMLNNSADSGYGGGVASRDSSITLIDSWITENQTADGRDAMIEGSGGSGGVGGGIWISNGSATLIGCWIAENQTGDAGKNGSNVEVGMPGGNGAGVAASGSAQVTMLNCAILRNQTGEGGVQYSPTGYVWLGGRGGDGAGVWIAGGPATIADCLIAGNRTGAGAPAYEDGLPGASGNGAGIYVATPSSASIINCTITDNQIGVGPGPTPAGGAIGKDGSGDLAVENSLLWNNVPGEVDLVDGTLSVRFCDVEGGWSGTGNIDSDPLFADADGADDDPNTLDDNDYRLTPSSPAVNGGLNVLLPTDAEDLDGDMDTSELLPIDLDGNPRIQECRVDMGAYESPYSTPFVDCDNDSIDDNCQLAADPGADCDQNGVLDACELNDPNNDCNGNGILDACEPDCNGNGIPDECEIAADPGLDCNGDGVLDACQTFGPFPGAALEFDGESSYVTVAHDAEIEFSNAENITIEAWIRPDALDVTSYIISKNRAGDFNYFFRQLDGKLRFGYRNASDNASYQYESTNVVLAAGAWSHVAVTHQYGTSTIELFVDGAPVVGGWVGNSPSQGPFETGSDPVLIGATRPSSGGGQTGYFDGAIDEVRIWSIARNQADIEDDMFRGLTGGEPGLVAYWRFDEGSGTSTYDEVSTREAAISDATWIESIVCPACPGDLDGSDAVDLTDLGILLGNYGLTPAAPDEGDINRDGTVDLTDLGLLLGNYNAVCP